MYDAIEAATISFKRSKRSIFPQYFTKMNCPLMSRTSTILNVKPFFCFLFLLVWLLPAASKAAPLPFSNLDYESIFADSSQVLDEFGHARCAIIPTVNCIDHTITLAAFQVYNFTGVVEQIVVDWSTGQNAHKIIVAIGGTYTYSTVGFTCDHFANSITVPDFFPGPLDVVGPSVICPGDVGELTVDDLGYDFTSYVWSPANPSTQFSPYSISTAGNYSLTVTDQNGCTYTDNKIVTLSPPVIPFVSGPPVMCSVGDTVILIALGGPFQMYEWNTGATTNNIMIYEPGVYDVTVTNALGCTGQSLLGINPGETPTSITATAPAICPGMPDTLTAVGSFISYQWSSGQSTKKIIVTQAGTYIVTVTNVIGCTSTATFVVLPISPPAPSLTPPILCPGGSALITTGGGVFNTYLWSSGQGTPAITISSSGTYTVTVSNNIGCTGTASVTVNTALPPNIAISGPGSACTGQSASLDVTPGFSSYIWSTGGNGTSITVNQTGAYTVTVTGTNGCTSVVVHNFTINNAPAPQISISPYACDNQITLSANPGYAGYQWSNSALTQTISVQAGGTYTVTVTAGVGCSGTSSQTVSIPANPQVSVSGPAQFCQGASGQLLASAGFQQYLWDSGAATATITVSQSGTYTVTVTDGNGCTATNNWQVTATPLPQPLINGPVAICLGNSAQLSLSNPFSQYLWSGGQTSASITASQTGTYTVTVTDANGCTGLTTHALTVNNSLSTQVTASPYACNSQINLAADPGFTVYQWSNGASTQNTAAQANGNYTVTVTDAMGCTGTAIQTVSIPPNPVAAILGPTQICQGGTAQFSLTGTFPQYQWSTGDTQSSISVMQNGAYTITVTDGNGCTDVATQVLNFGTSISIAISVSPYVCDGQLTLTPGPGFATYQWSNGAVTPTIAVQSNGTYDVTITDATGCTGTNSLTVSIPVAPQVSVAGPAQLCAGTSGQLQASGNYPQYQWSGGQSTSTITISQTGTYTVTATDAIGCTVTTNAQATVLPPVVPVLNGPTLICPGSSAPFGVNGSFSQYAWSTGSATPSISVSQNGTYTVTVTDANGCTGTGFQALAISVPPSPQATVAPYACNSQLNISTGAGFATYAWSNGGNTQTISAQANGTYTVTVTDALGCTGTVSQSVSIPANPQIAVTGPAQVCAGASGQLQAGGTFPQYQWSNGQSVSTITVSQTGNYTVTVTDQNGCTASSNTQFTVLPPVQVLINGPSSACPGIAGQLNAGASFSQYAWSSGGSGSSVSVTQSGNYTVTVTDANGCTGTASHAFSINNAPSVGITVAPYACNNQLNLAASGIFPSYAWSNGASASASIAVQTSGTYTLTVTDAQGCTGTALQTVVVPANPQVTVSGPAQLCAGDSGQFQASGSFPQYAWSGGQTNTSIAVSQTGAYTVTVTDGNGCTATASLALTVHPNSATQIQLISCFAQDTGSVVLQLSNQFGCDSLVVTHTALAPPVSVVAAVTSDFNGMAVPCFGSEEGSALATPGGGTAPFSFSWNNNATTAALNNLGAGTYLLTVTDANGCTTKAGVILTQPVPIVPELELEDVECFYPGVIRIASIAGGTAPFTVACNGETQTGDGVSPLEFEDVLPGTFPVLVTDVNGCFVLESAELLSPISSIQTFSDSFWINAGTKLRLKAPTGFDPLSVTWTPSAGLSCTTCLTVEATVFETTEYTVTLQGYGDCAVIGKYLVRVRPNIYVPNVILPGSTDNSLFTIYSGEGNVNIRLLQIYSRWGEKLVELRDFAPNGPTGWEGDFRGHPVSPGVYVYYAEVLQADGSVYLLKGDVTVVR